MAKDNMGIADSEFTSGALLLASYAAALDNQIQSYLSVVNIICEEAIQNQQIRSRLGSLCTQVQSVREPLNSAVSQAVKDCRSFIKAVDSADKFLY